MFQAPRYQELPEQDNDHSSTELEESPFEDNEKWKDRKLRTRAQGSWERVRAYWWIVDVCLLLIIVSLLADHSFSYRKSGGRRKSFQAMYCSMC